MSNMSFKIDVSFSGEASEQDVIEYIKYQIGYSGGCSMNNPFLNEDDKAEISIDDVNEY